MISLPLFDPCAGKHGGNAQSEAAHESIAPRKRELYALILEELERRGESGASCEQLSLALGLRVHSVSGRITELLRDGRIRDTGLRRNTSSGCTARVVVAVTT